MTLLETIKAIEIVAGKQPSVNSIVRDNVFLLNEHPDVKYGVFAWTQGQHSESMDSDWRTYRFTMFYVDRLTQDKSNSVECQSVGMDTLGNILRELAEQFDIQEWSIDPFTQRFADECAGCYATITLRSLRGGCFEDFPELLPGDFNNDYNSDSLTWRGKEVAIIK